MTSTFPLRATRALVRRRDLVLARLIPSIIMIAALTGCCTVDRPCITRVSADRAAEITRLVRDWTGFQLVSCARSYWPGFTETYYVTTAHGPTYNVYHVRGHWEISQLY
jgi:hypothetical protein